MSRLFEPDDTVTLRVVRAHRVLPGDVFWGVEHDGGFALLSWGEPVGKGAVPSDRTDRVWIGGSEYGAGALVLIEVRA